LVFVAKNARNAGIGTLLLQRMLAWAADNHVDRIQLNANAKSARLYQKVGFGPAPARLMERRI
jgi:GNAT superfamily N-acetyltransferase